MSHFFQYISDSKGGGAANTDARISFSVPIPLNRVDRNVTGQYVSYGTDHAESQSMDKPLVLIISNEIENSVKRG